MKTMIFKVLTAALILIFPAAANAQNQKSLVRNYMTQLPGGKPDFREGPQKYRMTAIYTNRDLYGNFTGKTRISGDYTCGLENKQASWLTLLGWNDQKTGKTLFPPQKRPPINRRYCADKR